MAEETVYSDKNVDITSSRICIEGTTYALRNVTSVRMAMSPAKRLGALLVVIFFLVSFLLSFGAFGEGFFVGLIAVGINGLLLYATFCYLRGIKNQYHVQITSSSGEANAMTSNDQQYIETVVGHINSAIANY